MSDIQRLSFPQGVQSENDIPHLPKKSNDSPTILRVLIFETKSMVLLFDDIFSWKWNQSKDDIRALIATFVKFGRDFDHDEISRVVFNQTETDKKSKRTSSRLYFSPCKLSREAKKVQTNIEMLCKTYSEYCIVVFRKSVNKYLKLENDRSSIENMFERIYNKFKSDYGNILPTILDDINYVNKSETTKTDSLYVEKSENILSKYSSFANTVQSLINNE